MAAYCYLSGGSCFVMLAEKTTEIRFDSLSDAINWAEKNHIHLMG